MANSHGASWSMPFIWSSGIATSETRKRKLWGVQEVRAFGLAAIVFIHVFDAMNILNGPAAHGIRLVSLNSNVYFFFIAGLLMAHTSAHQGTSEFLRRKARNLVGPYLAISAPAIAIYVLGLKPPPIAAPSTNPGSEILFYLWTGSHLGPLWFLPPLLMMFALFPVWKAMTLRPGLAWILIPLAFLPFVIERPEHNDNPVQAFAHFVVCFAAGVAYRAWSVDKPGPARDYVLMGCALVFTSTAAMLVSGQEVDWEEPIALFNKLAATPLLIQAFSSLAYVYKSVLAHRIANASFSIYLLHGYFIALVKLAAGQNATALNPQLLAEALALTAIVIAICYLMTLAAHGVLGRWSKVVIGY